MKENTKYYYKKTVLYPLSLILILLILVYEIFIGFESGDGLLHLITSWLVIIMFGILTLLIIFVSIQSYRNIGYVELKNETLYLKNLFGVTKSSILKGRFVCKRRKEQIKFITLYNDENTIELIIGNGFTIELSKIEELLIFKNDTTE